MREVSVFYSYDDREFFDRDECLEHEQNIFNIVKNISNKYSFFDKDMNIYMPPVNSEIIEDWVSWLSDSCEVCEYIYRDENLKEEEEHFMREEFGGRILNEDFENKIGWFKYNATWNEWEKVEDN